MRQDDDPIAPRLFIVGHEPAAKDRLNAECGQPRSRDHGAVDRAARSVRKDDRELRPIIRGDPLEDVVLVTDVREIWKGHVVAR